MTLEFTHQYAHSIATRVLQFLRTNLTSSFAAFFNTETLAIKVHDAVKKALTGTSLPPADLILVHGSQDAFEKYHYT
jgi:hypothetical protein